MTLAAEKEIRHIGETQGVANHDHDLIHELSKRLDALWRYDQYIANAEGREKLQAFWRDRKKEDQKVVDQLRELVAAEIENNCF